MSSEPLAAQQAASTRPDKQAVAQVYAHLDTHSVEEASLAAEQHSAWEVVGVGEPVIAFSRVEREIVFVQAVPETGVFQAR